MIVVEKAGNLTIQFQLMKKINAQTIMIKK